MNRFAMPCFTGLPDHLRRRHERDKMGSVIHPISHEIISLYENRLERIFRRLRQPIGQLLIRKIAHVAFASRWDEIPLLRCLASNLDGTDLFYMNPTLFFSICRILGLNIDGVLLNVGETQILILGFSARAEQTLPWSTDGLKSQLVFKKEKLSAVYCPKTGVQITNLELGDLATLRFLVVLQEYLTKSPGNHIAFKRGYDLVQQQDKIERELTPVLRKHMQLPLNNGYNLTKTAPVKAALVITHHLNCLEETALEEAAYDVIRFAHLYLEKQFIEHPRFQVDLIFCEYIANHLLYSAHAKFKGRGFDIPKENIEPQLLEQWDNFLKEHSHLHLWNCVEHILSERRSSLLLHNLPSIFPSSSDSDSDNSF